MVELTLWAFPTSYSADAVVNRLKHLCGHQLIRVEDGALVCWPERRPVPTVKPLAELPRRWRLDDAFWGLLAGMLFHQAQLPGCRAEGQNPLSEGLAALGLDGELLAAVRARVVAGTSGLLLVVDAENARRIGMAIEGMPFTIVERPLSPPQEQRLRSTFGAFAD
jgi:uncharacterized membrane protein